MADSTGTHAANGAPISDWPHVAHHVGRILTTPRESLPTLREFGSDIPDLIDAKMIQKNILAVYSAAAVAIARWEPRFRVTHARVVDATAGGVLGLEIAGSYFPRGHLGDFSVVETASTRVLFGAAR